MLTPDHIRLRFHVDETHGDERPTQESYGRTVRIEPDTLEVGLSPVFGIHVVLHGRPLKKDGERAERGQRTLSWVADQHAGNSGAYALLSGAPKWVQDIAIPAALRLQGFYNEIAREEV